MSRRNRNRGFIDFVVEFIIVLLGITIAFWLTNLGEKRKEGQLEDTYLSQLREDIVEDIQALKSSSEFDQSKVNLMEKGIKYVAENNNRLRADSIIPYVLAVGSYNFFTPTDQTYLTLSQSGDLALIQNQELKKKLVSLYQSYGSIKTEQGNIIQALDDNFFPELNKAIDRITGELKNPRFFISHECTNYIAFIRDETSRLMNYGKFSKRLAEQTLDLIDTEIGQSNSGDNPTN